jgi:hypothetical protein
LLLVRLAHSFVAGEDATLSAPATVDLAGLFPAFNITSVEEMTVSGNQPLAGVPLYGHKALAVSSSPRSAPPSSGTAT